MSSAARDTVPDAGPSGRTLSIGEVLTLLRPDYPDVSISKIRFLEAERLVEPARAPSGYRRFSDADVARLRYVLTAQRDHYLPLKVIREHLDAIDRGLEPPSPLGRPGLPRATRTDDPDATVVSAEHHVLLTRDELLAETGATPALLRALESHGLVRSRDGGALYDAGAVEVVRLAIELGEYGLEPRHLRAFRTAADREVGLVEQVVTPMLRQRGGDGAARADDTVRELSSLSVRLHTLLVRVGVRDLLGG